MKKTIFTIVVWTCSLICFISSYFYWSKAKETLLKSDAENLSYDTEKVEAMDFYEEYTMSGEIKSDVEKVYTVDALEYTLADQVKVGAQVKVGDVLCISKTNKKSKSLFDVDGTVTKIETTDENSIKITVEDPNHLKACFYVPQKYCKYYELGNKVTVSLNEENYEAVVSFIDSRMSDRESQEQENEVKELYVEAALENSAGVYINSEIVINEKVCIVTGVKAVPKSTIHYKDDNAYIKILTESQAVKDVFVGLGNSDENMVEIISDEVYVGDQVIVEE